MKKILQQLFIIALFFFPFVSSAEISNIYVSAIPATNIVELNGAISQVDYSNQYPAILADFAISDKPTTNCASIAPNPSFFGLDVPQPDIYDGQGNLIAIAGNLYNIDVPPKIIQGLTAGTTYYYCLYATEGSINNPLSYSSVETFKTKPKVTLTASPNPVPSGGNSVLTWTVEGAVSCSATGGTGGWAGSKDKNGGSQNINDIRVKTTFTLTCSNGFNYGNTVSNVTVNISNTASTNNIGSVITLPLPGGTETINNEIVRIEPEKVLQVTDTTALLQGKILNAVNLGDSDKPNYGYFRISKVDIPPIFCNDIFGSNMISTISDTPRKNGSVVSGDTFSKRITGLEPDTEYAYCAIVSNHAEKPSEIRYGQVVNFRTNPCVTCPHTTIRTLNPANIGTNSAILQGSYNSTRQIKTWFEYKEKGLDAAEDPKTPLDYDQSLIESSKKLAISHILGSSFLEYAKFGANTLKEKIIIYVNAAIPEWKTTQPVSYIGTRNYGRMTYTLTGLKKDTVYQYRAVAETIEDKTRPNPNPIQTFRGNTVEFRTRIYGDNQDVLAHCFNNVQDFGETGIDIGGGCPSKAPNCFDNIKNGNETGVDEGGSCGKPAHCFNGIQDTDKGETGIDTGGPCGPAPTCPPGTTGTYPNCVPGCPTGYTGTYPNCVPPPFPTISVTANPSLIKSGQSSTISWTSTNTTSCTAINKPNIKQGPIEPTNENTNNNTNTTNSQNLGPNNIPLADAYLTNNTGYDTDGSGDSPSTASSSTSGSFNTGFLDKGRSFTVRCTGPNGSVSGTAYVFVNNTIDPSNFVTVKVTASPTVINPGQSSTISWTSTNATSCTSSGGGGTETSGNFSTGSLNFSRAYSVSCTGANGSGSGSAYVFVPGGTGTGGGGVNNNICPSGFTGTPPNCTAIKKVTADISASPIFIQKGGNVTVSWTSTNATSCSLSGPAIGTIKELSSAVGIPNIQTKTTWGISCVGETGSASDSATVFILDGNSCPPGFTGTPPNCTAIKKVTADISASPIFIQKGGNVTVSWTSTNATSCSLSGPAIGTIKELSSAVGIPNIQTKTTWGISCVGETGSASDSATVFINGTGTGNEDGGDCPFGFTGTLPNCVASGVCPTGTTGIYPNCRFDRVCPNGSTGTYPNCEFTDCPAGTVCVCPTNYTGTYPNCRPPIICPSGMTGTYPNCIFDRECPTGYGGTYPSCVREYNCPTGAPGVYPNCYSDGPLPAHCYNGVQDFDETGVDTGGSCTIRNLPAHCYNGVQDTDKGETGIDTGGPCGLAPTCPAGFTGNFPTCIGPTPPNCTTLGTCPTPTCPLGFTGTYPICNSISTTPVSPFNHCTNGIQDFGETSIDRGGGCGGVYVNNPTCFDNVQNGGETGVDTGGHCGDGPNNNGEYPSCFDNTQNGSETGVDTGGHCGNTNNGFDWIDFIFPDYTGTGTGVGNCVNGTCTGTFNFNYPGYTGPISGNWLAGGNTGTYTGNCVNGTCTGTFTGTIPGLNGPFNGTFTGGFGDGSNNPNYDWTEMTFPGFSGTGNTNGSCTNGICNGSWNGVMPGYNGPVVGIWSSPDGTGPFTGTCTTAGCTGSWTGVLPGYNGPNNGNWTGGNGNGSNGNGNNQNWVDISFDGINGTGTFTGNCTVSGCSGEWTGLVPGHNGPISGTWTGPNGTGTFTGNCVDGVCTGTWTGGNGNVGPINGTWNGGNGDVNDITTITLDQVDGTGTFTGNCTTASNCTGTWEGGQGNTGQVQGTWTGPDGNGTFTGNCTAAGCTGTWTGNNDNSGSISGVWNGGKGEGNVPASMDFDGINGTGTFSGTCDKETCRGEWTGLVPGHNGPITGKWTGPHGTGTFTGTCINGVCTGTWVGGKGDEGVIYGTWDGTNGNGNPNDLYLGYEGTPDVDDIVRLHEGVEHVFIRRIMINTELARKYGYKKGDNLLYFAWDLAHKFAQEFGYVDGQGREIRVNQPDVSAYQLRQVGNKLTVYEFYKNKIIDIRDTTTVFKDKNSYEYYFQKN